MVELSTIFSTMNNTQEIINKLFDLKYNMPFEYTWRLEERVDDILELLGCNSEELETPLDILRSVGYDPKTGDQLVTCTWESGQNISINLFFYNPYTVLEVDRLDAEMLLGDEQVYLNGINGIAYCRGVLPETCENFDILVSNRSDGKVLDIGGCYGRSVTTTIDDQGIKHEIEWSSSNKVKYATVKENFVIKPQKAIGEIF